MRGGGKGERAGWRRGGGVMRDAELTAWTVENALMDPRIRELSNYAAAEVLGVGLYTLRHSRRRMEAAYKIPVTVARIGRDGRTTHVSLTKHPAIAKGGAL